MGEIYLDLSQCHTSVQRLFRMQIRALIDDRSHARARSVNAIRVRIRVSQDLREPKKMNKTQRVVWNKQSGGGAYRGSRERSSFVSQRMRIGTAAVLTLTPLSLLTLSATANAALVDNLAYAAQVRQALGVLSPQTLTASNMLAAATPALGAGSGTSGLSPDQMVISGPIDGTNSTGASGMNAVAVGVNARATGDYAVAVGSYANAAAGGVAVGNGVSSSGVESTALGVGARADSDRSLAIGWRTTVNTSSDDSLAIGSFTRVTGLAAGGIGMGNFVSGSGNYVVGNSNKALGTDSFVLGSNVTARGSNSVVLGASSDGSLSNVVSVGDSGTERRIVHVAGARDGTDAVNLNQLKALGARTNTAGVATNAFVAYDNLDKTTIALGGTSGQAVRISNVAVGALNPQSSDAVNGAQLYATNSNVHDVATSLAQLTSAEPLKLSYTDESKANVMLGGTNGTVISNVKAGVMDQDAVNVAQLKSAGLIDASGNAAAAITYDMKADGTVDRSSATLGGAGAAVPVALRNVAAGAVKAGSTDAVNGDQLFQTAQLVDSLRNGGALKYFNANTTLVAASATGADAAAIGGNAQASAGNSVALGANSVADRTNTVSVGAAGNERQITNVRAGTSDTDAVNVAQLKSAGLVDETGKAETALTYDKNASGAADFGSVTLGKGIAGGTLLHNVASGVVATDGVNLGQLNDAVSRVNNFTASSTAFFAADGDASKEAAVATGNHAVAFGANATATAASSVALGAGSVADRAPSVSVGAPGSERQITNVAAGTSSTDAVNLDQLSKSASSTLSQANSYTDQRFSNTDQQIRDLDRNTRKGIASASALNVVTPYLPGRTTLNAGVAAYRGQAALGIGVSRWNDKGNINFNGGVSSSGGNSTIVRAGVGYVFGI